MIQSSIKNSIDYADDVRRSRRLDRQQCRDRRSRHSQTPPVQDGFSMARIVLPRPLIVMTVCALSIRMDLRAGAADAGSWLCFESRAACGARPIRRSG